MCWLDSSLLQISPSAWGSRNLGADSFGPHFCWLPSPEKDWTAPLDLILLKLLKQTWLAYLPSNHLILYHPLLLLPSVFPSIRVFSNESILHIRWPKYWSFSISPSKEYSELISFRIDWFDLILQGTLKSSPTPQFKASIFWYSPFFMVQLSYPYMKLLSIGELFWRWNYSRSKFHQEVK